MIDFRYHVVSIVAVFLALAVGIVLGAGPLKEDIGSTLTAQVTQLRADKNALREQLKESEDGVAARDTYAGLVAPGVIADQLKGRTVTVLALPDADAGLVKRTTRSLTGAGATLADTIQLGDAWTDPDQASERTETVTRLARLVGVEPSVVGARELPSLVLTRAIFGPPPDAKVTTGEAEGSSRVLDGLESAGLVSVQSGRGGPATAVVVVAGPPPEDGTQQQDRSQSSLALLTTFTNDDRPAVLVSGHQPGQGVSTANPLVSAVRGDAKLNQLVSTVDDGNLSMGQGTLVLALHDAYAGQVGHFGIAGDAAAVAPEMPAKR